MKKTKKLKCLEIDSMKNPVAKFAHQFNKYQVFKDKTRYQRKAKHKEKEPFLMLFLTLLEKAPSL